MDDADRTWSGPDAIRAPKDADEQAQAEKLGMLVITGIESIANGEKWSGLPCGFEAVIRVPNGAAWCLALRPAIEGEAPCDH